ncbi:FAD/NAD(P)-binding domain-containing protein [Aspergillus karnatakaensis]|uniref:NAD(P)/FAD-dependent oxidoreductase n=1 Tax=Aspergillus karnatakaensis TaxID=1810916 RepID=UPI003CCD8A0E
MSIPTKCTVLVIGGGPGGSYAAAVLAREGIDTVLLEGEKFPRYHIGESMLPSMRHYLRLIDLDEEFVNHGFTKKVGAAFRVTPDKQEGWTDFITAGGPDNYTWNVIRSEADEMIFRHAGKCGAKTFDGVRVNEIQFVPSDIATKEQAHVGRPVSATYTRKTGDSNSNGVSASESAENGTGTPTETGAIEFDYLIDASGRAGILSTKYLKNRQYSKALKNIAHWAYYRDMGKYGRGTEKENSPFFEALADESGWAWFIPLHNNTTSVGIVRHQRIANALKKQHGSTEVYYDESLKLLPVLTGLMDGVSSEKRVSPIHSASDYSYAASTYALPYARIVGDAGCFIDPFFSSGVHLALTGGLAAATTIAASIKGDVEEKTAAAWHSEKVREGYARFLLVVLSIYKQMGNQRDAVLSDFGESNFDRAFEIFRPVIQGEVDTSKSGITQAEFSTTINFLANVLDPSREDLLRGNGEKEEDISAAIRREDAEAKMEVLKAVRSGQEKEWYSMGNFTTDVVDGRVPRVERGGLTLVLA